MKVGSTVIRGQQTYARAATAERLEAATANEAVRQTRSIGFTLGKFSVQYETEEGLAHDQLLRQAAQQSAKQAAKQTIPTPDLTSNGLKQQTALSMFSQNLDLTASWQRREGAKAYARADAAYQTEQRRPMLSGLV